MGLGIPQPFLAESTIQDWSRTPVFADGIEWWWEPKATDLPAANLAVGNWGGGPYAMGVFTIPRHGSQPSRVSTNHSQNLKLPGAINVGFYDGHVETVQLERLWQLYWHRDYRPPARRPGL